MMVQEVTPGNPDSPSEGTSDSEDGDDEDPEEVEWSSGDLDEGTDISESILGDATALAPPTFAPAPVLAMTQSHSTKVTPNREGGVAAAGSTQTKHTDESPQNEVDPEMAGGVLPKHVVGDDDAM